MSVARHIRKGETYVVTRRVLLRQLLLLPKTRVVYQAFLFALALYAKRHGILVHAVVVMGNHWHAVVTDVRGTLPAFSRDFHSLTARCMNRYLKRKESLWSSDKTNMVRLEGATTVLRRIIYVILNPVRAGLVARAAEWSGLITRVSDYSSGARRVQRPKVYFGRDTSIPGEVEIEFVPPPQYASMGGKEFGELVEMEVARAEAEIQSEFRAVGKSFMTMKRVNAQRRTSTPSTASHERNDVVPAVAADDPATRRQMRRELQLFRAEYREAMKLWKQWVPGLTPIEFPHGTYKMKDMPGVLIREQMVVTART